MINWIIGIWLVFIAASIYMLIRNSWVCRNRIKLIYLDMSAYDAAPSYDVMLHRYFWDWNFDRLCKRSRT